MRRRTVRLTNLIACSPSMRRLVAQIQSLARNARLTVLLQGETGTGKEFLARVLHHNGPRAAGPFVAVHCTAIPQNLFESELFGYERGAFTGAYRRKRGLMEIAEGGTLFLDKIGDLDHAMQAKLVRVLQERTFSCVGGTASITLNLTLIAATNRDLQEEIVRGAFRQDLYFRLKVVQLEVPPLRDRFEDILPLCRQAVLRYGREFGKEVSEIDPEAEALLQSYGYPGNVRELHNIIERAVIFCQDRRLTAGYLPDELRQRAYFVTHATGGSGEQIIKIEAPLEQVSLKKIEQAVVWETLHLTEYNKSLAAKYLGISRYALNRRLKGSASRPGKAFSQLRRGLNYLATLVPLSYGSFATLLDLIQSCHELKALLID